VDERFAAMGGWPGVLTALQRGRSLSEEEVAVVLDQILAGSATPAQTAGFLVALGAKGESVAEMAGMVRSMLAHAEPLELAPGAVDVVGTGGDRLGSINVSTLSALVAAGAGLPVCKHGNRAASGSVGTADVLEALGVVVELDGDGVARCVTEAGMGFCFAQRFHPCLRFVGPVRAELGIPTIFNFLGPLAHPARVRRQLVGVNAPAMAERMASVLGANGSERAMVVFADDGLDELSVTAPTTVMELTGAGDGRFEVRQWRVDPADLGFAAATLADLRGGDAAFNAEVIRRVLDGEPGAHRDIGVLNAAAALVVGGRAPDLRTGVAQASAAIDSGAAARVLEALVRVSTEAASV
jgi:anthranilate phosphoribosyltransferase